MDRRFIKGIALLCAFVLQFCFAKLTYAQESVCAVVKIEILQELTLERQGFEANLDIENTLDDKTIENIEVVVNFKDEDENDVVATSDPNDTSASFFIRVNSLDGIENVELKVLEHLLPNKKPMLNG